jgi:hypothetical protein
MQLGGGDGQAPFFASPITGRRARLTFRAHFADCYRRHCARHGLDGKNAAVVAGPARSQTPRKAKPAPPAMPRDCYIWSNWTLRTSAYAGFRNILSSAAIGNDA